MKIEIKGLGEFAAADAFLYGDVCLCVKIALDRCLESGGKLIFSCHMVWFYFVSFLFCHIANETLVSLSKFYSIILTRFSDKLDQRNPIGLKNDQVVSVDFEINQTE